jgi:drug/metabolite transporter (DMT)-like permease
VALVDGSVPGRAGGWPLAAAGLGAACISGTAILVQLAHTGAATAVFYSCLPALPALTALAVIEQRRRGQRRPGARLGAVLAGLFLAAELVLWNHAISDVGAGIATVLGSLQVPFVALAAWMLLQERPDRRFLIALPVVMAGVVLVSGLAGGAMAGSRPMAGTVFGIGSAVGYAVFLLILRQASAGTPHIAGPLADATAGAVFGSVLLGLSFGGFPLDIPLPSFGWLLLLSFSTRTVGWLLITSSLPRLPAAVSSLLLLLQPAAALLLAAAVLGERPSPVQLTGAVLLCGGVVMVGRKAQRRTVP